MRFFTAPTGRRLLTELVALLDIVFLLLIFLLVTTRFANESQLRVSLPDAAGTEARASAEQFEVVVDSRGRYWVGGTAVRPPTLRNLMRQMRTTSGGDRELLVRIRADERAQHREVVMVMDAASRLGFSRISIDVHVPEEQQPEQP